MFDPGNDASLKINLQFGHNEVAVQINYGNNRLCYSQVLFHFFLIFIWHLTTGHYILNGVILSFLLSLKRDTNLFSPNIYICIWPKGQCLYHAYLKQPLDQ